MANNGYIKSSATDPLSMPFNYAVTLGRVAGHSRVIVNGRSSSIVVGNDVWEGNSVYPLLNAASQLEILSSSASDAAAGTGARSFTLQGLDANFNQISETVALNGVTPVATANAYLRVNRLLIQSAGSGLTNAGTVTLRVVGGGTTQGIAAAGTGPAKTGVYTVPAGFTLLLTEMEFDVSGGGTANTVTYGIARQVPGGNGPFWIQGEFVAGAITALERTLTTGAIVAATNTVSVRVTGVSGTVGGHVSFSALLIDNTYIA